MNNIKGSQLLAGNKESKNVYTFIDNNHLYCPTLETLKDTLLQVPKDLRHKGLWVTYQDDKGINHTLIYQSSDCSDEAWRNINNWKEYEIETNIEIEATAEDTNGNAEVTVIPINENRFRFDFKIPKGQDGQDGINGRDGRDGSNGLNGLQGPQGPKGDAGDLTIATRTVFVFKSTGESIIAPETPIGGSWNANSNIIIPPAGWNTDDHLEGIIWMSNGTFAAQTGKLIGKWSDPVRITGKDGLSGADGVNLEFIYKLTTNILNKPIKPNSIQQTDYIPDGWTDSPTGISEINKVEWVCTRSKATNGWSDYSEPAIWSKWGENGKDGDGVEYIYKRTNVFTAPDVPLVNIDSQEYQQLEYVPEGWTDDPTGVNEEYPYEWVCTRKYRNGSWEAFEGSYANKNKAALWAAFGKNGFNGLGIRMMYCKTKNASEEPVVVRDNINPGSLWSLITPKVSNDEVVWAIQAVVTYDNKLNGEWQGPWIISGINGKNGTPIRYKTYIYKNNITKPDKPTFDNPNNLSDGWVDYPNSADGQWWQCIGTVDGATDLVIEWGEVIPVNGKNGEALPGVYTELRFNYSNTPYDAPEIDIYEREPSGWVLSPYEAWNDNYIWMTIAQINSDNTLVDTWSDPVRISGEQGPQGEAGPVGGEGPAGADGVSGIPGVTIEPRYCIGTDKEPKFSAPYNSKDRNPENWNDNIDPVIESINEDYPYIWCIQGRIYFDDNNDIIGHLNNPWSKAFRLSGVNGLDGAASGNNQIIYPAGIFEENKQYISTERKTPYVYDTSDGNFYVLNIIGFYNSTIHPCQSDQWVLMESFEALFTKVGIIGNGLIGSAVFNGDWMFSQQGEGNYEDFNPVNGNPYDNDFGFKPATAINFKTGESFFCKGAIRMIDNQIYIYTPSGNQYIPYAHYITFGDTGLQISSQQTGSNPAYGSIVNITNDEIKVESSIGSISLSYSGGIRCKTGAEGNQSIIDIDSKNINITTIDAINRFNVRVNSTTVLSYDNNEVYYAMCTTNQNDNGIYTLARLIMNEDGTVGYGLKS